MKTYILLPKVNHGDFLPKLFIDHFTKPGDTVFDPFAGYGTTLLIAEHMGRIPFGIELDDERYEYTRSKLGIKENIIHGDSRKLDEFPLPSIDFVFTSPIFMLRDETKNPLAAWKEDGTYQVYLDQLQDIFRKLREFLNPGARVVVEVFNYTATDKRPMTLLAWDITIAISEVLRFDKEIIACWHGVNEDGTSDVRETFGYDHHYCLVFVKD
ncbi:MAG: DNA methyltransferase [Candidatus Thorarchaeota archaeon]